MTVLSLHPSQKSDWNINKEQLGIFFWLLLFLLSPQFVRLFDPTAAFLDAGVLGNIILAIVAVLVFKAITWWLIRTIWPVLAEYSKNSFESTFNKLLPWQKVLTFLVFYLFLLYAFVCCFVSVL